MEYVLSAHKSKQIPFRPQTFYKVLEACLPHLTLQPSRSFGELICREFEMTAEQLGAIAVFLVKTQPHTSGRDRDEERKLVRLQLMYMILHSAALLGDPAAVVLQYQLFDGLSKRDYNSRVHAETHEALKRVQEVARQGYAPALAIMGTTLDEKGATAAAIEAFVKCGEAGNGDGYAQAGRLLLRENREEAKRLWRKGAFELDSARCYYNLSVTTDVNDPDHERFMLKAAASGVRGAAHGLGILYSRPSKKNFALAKEWYCVSVDDGMVESVHNLVALLKKEGTMSELPLWVGPGMLLKANITDVGDLKAKGQFGDMTQENVATIKT